MNNVTIISIPSTPEEGKAVEMRAFSKRATTVAKIVIVPAAMTGYAIELPEYEESATSAAMVSTAEVNPMPESILIHDPDGIGRAVAVRSDQYKNCIATAEILADAAFTAKLKKSISELEAGKVRDWDDVKASLGL